MTSSDERWIVSGERRRSAGRVLERARRVAAGLAGLGVTSGSAVAILMRNSIEFLEASNAIGRLGAYAVPLNWHLTPDEIAYVVQDCEARILVAHRDLLGLIPPGLIEQAGITTIVVETPDEVRTAYALTIAGEVNGPALSWDDWIAAQEPLPEERRSPAPESTIYTSGTTGRPKGVRRRLPTAEQKAELDRLREEVYFLKPGIRLLVPAPLYHAAPNVFSLRGLEVADTLVLMPKFDPENFLRMVEEHRITSVVMVPTMFVRLLRLPQEVRRAYDISSLKTVLHAAAPCPPEVKRQIIDWFGPVIYEWYGTTETSVVTRCSTEEWLRFPGTVGRPIKGARIEIIDADGEPAPAGQEGEIYMKLEFMPDFTYHKRDADRATVGLGDLVTGGDIGYLNEDGFLFICDRKKDMVISGGVNIYPSEIESALLELPEVADCAVIGIPDAEYGESLLAIVVPGSVISAEAIRSYLGSRLARFKVPKYVEFRQSLPRDDVGKLLKRKLREPYWQKA
ncbi:AMP-binding protein [Mesorhizobium sp. 1B3]|uniref:AMP-binding protein n=1 Tax=Mesorhizobium sp. 1B3 TaxID=3243599 RepID=UPI003D97013E